MRSRFLCLLPLLLLPSLASAFSSSTSGNQTTFGPFTATPSNVGQYAVSTASDGRVLVSSGARIPLAGGGSFPINVSGSISKPSAAAAIGRFLLKGSGVIGVLGLGVAAYELAQELGFTADNSSGSTVLNQPDTSLCTIAPCFEYRLSSGTFLSEWTRQPSPLAQQLATHINNQNGNITSCSQIPAVGSRTISVHSGVGFVAPSTARVQVQSYNCQFGQTTFTHPLTFSNYPLTTRSATVQQPSNVPATVSELEQKIIDQMVWPTSSKLGEAVAEAIRLNDSLPVLSPVVTGPATVPGASSTTVDDATGETTTTTQVVNNTYEGDKVTTTITTTTSVTNTATGAPIRQSVTTITPVAELPVSPETETPPFAMPCGIAGTPPCGVKVDESQTPAEVPADEFKPLLDEGKQAQEDLLDQVKSDADKSFFEPFTDLFVTPALAECVPLEIPGDRGTIDPCGTVGGARAIMAYIWALSGLALCLHMVRSAL